MGRTTFTDEQRAVIAHDSGHASVGAVPGSGKTTVLVARLRRLVRNHVDPATILTVMFNKAAQVGFDQRLRRAITGTDDVPSVRTFHSVGYTLLTKRLMQVAALPPREFMPKPKAMEIEAKKALRQVWRQQHGSGTEMSSEHVQGFVEFLTLVKSQTDTPGAVFKSKNYGTICTPYIEAFDLFEEQREERKQIYYDDMVYRPVKYLLAHPEAWDLFADRYDEILIDEFQDISLIQYEMIKGLAGKRAAVMAVGDADQSIYGFRGSCVSLLTKDFARDFSPCTRFPMTRTFRFGHEIALFANHIISHNKEREDRLTIADSTNPDSYIDLRPLTSKSPSGIVHILAPYANKGTLHKTALLVRNFAHGVPFELELAAAGIAFHVYGRAPLIFLPDIAAMVAALSIATGHWIVPDGDRLPFAQALLSAPSIYLVRDRVDEIAEAMEPDLSGPNRHRLPKHLIEAARQYATSNPRLARALNDRADIIKVLASGQLADKAPRVIAEAYIQMTGMREAIDRNAVTAEQADEAKATLDAFLQIAERAGTAIEFLDMLGPLAAHDAKKPPAHDHCAIMTGHRSKGLEFSVVMVAGLAKGIFPDPRSDSDMEEERRVCFVMVTRTIDRLVLFHPEDSTLTAMVENSAALPDADSPQIASPYMYEGDIGLAKATGNYLRNNASAILHARRGAIVKRYLNQVGRDDVKVVVSAAAQQWQSMTPLPRNFKPEPGEKLWHAQEGKCEVLRCIHHPVYLMRRIKDDGNIRAVIDESGTWGLRHIESSV